MIGRDEVLDPSVGVRRRHLPKLPLGEEGSS